MFYYKMFDNFHLSIYCEEASQNFKHNVHTAWMIIYVFF